MIRMNRELRSDLETTNRSIDRADFTLSFSLFLSLFLFHRVTGDGVGCNERRKEEGVQCSAVQRTRYEVDG